MNHLSQPSDDVLKAISRLEDNQDFQAVLTYLLDESAPVIGQKMKTMRDDVTYRWMQGAAQLLDDLRNITANAVGWMGKRLLAKQKEGTGNV